MKTNRNYKQTLRYMALLTLMTILLCISTTGWSQVSGDYRSATTGNWTALATWQRYNGTAWVTPSSGEGYPGQHIGVTYGTVLIQAGHTVTSPTASTSTQPMGFVTIANTGRLTLTASTTFTLNTASVFVNATTGTIFFNSKSVLVLPANATISVSLGGLSGSCNNNSEIYIGSLTKPFAACAGAPGEIFTFAELMAAGGTLNSVIATASPASTVCEGTTITLTGSYSGAAGTTTPNGTVPGVNYSWNITGPGGYSATAPTQSTTLPSSVLPGTYKAKLTVSTYNDAQLYTNTDSLYLTVNPLPTLSGASQPITVCNASPATIQLTGLVPNTTATVTYTIQFTPYSASVPLSDASGNSSFLTIILFPDHNGQTLRITGLTITSSPTNCYSSFSQDVTLSVWTTGPGTWTGMTNSDWNTASNWCGGVPTSSTDVYIPPPSLSVPNQPVIGAAGGLCRNITINPGASLTLDASNTLLIYGTWNNNGTFNPNTGTVNFTGTTAQFISGSSSDVFYNLTISNTGGITSYDDITVNGTLNLAASNPLSGVKGCLDLLYGSTLKTLTMGASATTTGDGDVTGKVLRTTINPETTYTFGSAKTSIRFYNAGSESMPTQLKFIIRISQTHFKKPNAVQRYYEIVRTGGSTPARFSLQLRYLDSEMNGNTESNLVYWDHHVPYNGPTPHEHGKSELNTTDNWISLSGHSIQYLVQNEYTGEITYIDDTQTPPNQSKIWMISGKESTSGYVWLGAVSTAWDVITNWSGSAVPTSTSDVIIPSGTSFTATLPDNTTRQLKSIAIEGGATLQGGSGSILEVYGELQANNGTASWSNAGTFSPGTSTVVFKNANAAISGTTNFYNLSIPADSSLSLLNNSITRVSGTFDKQGILDAYYDGPTTFSYNGSAQTVAIPADEEYYHLALDGSGTKTLPAQYLTVLGDLLITGAAGVNQADTLDVLGNFTNHSTVGGGLSMNGPVKFSGTVQQTIGGNSATSFSALVLNNPAGAVLGNSQTVTEILWLKNGILTTGQHVLTLTCYAGIAAPSETRYVDGKMARLYCGGGQRMFTIGKGGNYRPVTIGYESLTGTSTVTAEQFESPIPGTIPPGIAYQHERHWEITESGGSNINYYIYLDGRPFTPGTGAAKILKSNGTNISVLNATFNSSLGWFIATGQTSFSYFAVASDCPQPAITASPAATEACDGTGTATFSVTATGSGLTYQWEVSTGGAYSSITNGGVYSNATTATLTITNPPFSMNGYSYRVVVSSDCGTSTTSGTAVLTVYALPGITLGDSPAVCEGIATASLSYSATGGSPDQYRIDYDATAEGAGFTDVGYTSLTASPVSLVVPATLGTYEGMIYVKNSTTGCESQGYPFTVTIRALPQGILSGDITCSGGTGALTWDATAGTGPFTVVYNDGTGNNTKTGVYSGVPFVSFPNQTTSTHYTLVSVAGTYCTRTTGFTGGSATITVLGIVKTEISCYNAGDGQLTITVTGAGIESYDYSLDGGATYPYSGTSPKTIQNLTPGEYEVTVRLTSGG